VTLIQFVGPRFVSLCLGSQYDTAKRASGSQQESPPAVGWSGSDLDAFNRTKNALAAKLREHADGG
jgi:hypothetical protein